MFVLFRIKKTNTLETILSIQNLNKRFGKWQGKVVPHDLITELKVGDKFKAQDCITYNPAFFQYNWIAGTISYKMGVLANVALVENNDTLEDASAMSDKMAEKMSTKIVETRDVLVKFDQEIENLIKVGTEVEYDTVLCNLLDTLSTASSEKFFIASTLTPSAFATSKSFSSSIVSLFSIIEIAC